MSLYLKCSGNRRATPLLLIHGWGMHSDIWQPLVPHLEKHFFLLQLDLPGLGRSQQCYPNQYGLDTVTSLVADNVATQVDQPVLVCGWSLGGVIGARLTAQSKLPVEGLMTIASNPCFVQRSGNENGMDPETFQQFQNQLEFDWMKTLNRFAMLMAQGDSQSRALVKQVKGLFDLYQQQRPTKLAESLSLLEQDYRSLFHCIEQSRLHLFAENDALVPVQAAEDSSVNQHSQIISQSGHLLLLSHAEELAEIVLGFKEQISG